MRRGEAVTRPRWGGCPRPRRCALPAAAPTCGAPSRPCARPLHDGRTGGPVAVDATRSPRCGSWPSAWPGRRASWCSVTAPTGSRSPAPRAAPPTWSLPWTGPVSSCSVRSCCGCAPRTDCWARRGPGRPGTSGLTWVVDPIDGTVNYAYGLPIYSVSVAVVTGDVLTVGAWRRWRAACTTPPPARPGRRRAGLGATLDGVPTDGPRRRPARPGPGGDRLRLPARPAAPAGDGDGRPAAAGA